ncbi:MULTISPECIES: HD domain-containing protein [Frigoribacterium]|uniref:HD domain-containing protein n=1 Tax=Frigoribacterium TaxID=96492 RepID=UPI001784154F|nr:MULTISPECIES: HD domain-containing protein [Frigoribacterium]MBD8704812.1 HD domain-containing protein [Frigoribacterium sp. CFBP 13712]MCJ0702484.1 HD domain-containing protein [Frigoribacterium faeni]MDY0893302.1 HD domain-containing protein [Frigoribacterium sp. CFBP9030]
MTDSSRLDRLLTPPTPVAERALAVVRAHASPALADHSLRSFAFAAELGASEGLEVDVELLWVAAMLHDLGLAPSFDSHTVPFERAGADVARVFAAGAGWSDDRGRRVAEVIERHMWPSVAAELDVEGHLLERATSLDVSGAAPDDWAPGFVRAVVERLPRGAFGDAFAVLAAEQAHRKPSSEAGRSVRAGLPARARANPLDAVPSAL